MELQERKDDDDEDEDVQLVIQQSLMETHRENRQEAADINQIFFAIRDGDEELVRNLSVGLRDVFSGTDNHGWTPLHAAAAQRNHRVLEITLAASGPQAVDVRSGCGQTPLYVAVERGLMENASFLLEHQADPDSQDQDLDSPLFVAIRSGRLDLVKLLLSKGSLVNRQGCHGRRPLHEAARLVNISLVRLLLEAGAQPDPRSHYGLTPLALAAQGGNLEVVETLLRKGADVLSQAKDEASVLYEASASGDPNVIALLLEHGADANVANQTGHLPIHRTAHRGHLQALKLLLPVTAISDVEDSGISPLHSAAAGGHTHCIQVLLDAGFDPNFMLRPWVRRNYDDERKSALFFAVSNNDVSSARLLLEGGAMANQDPIKCLQVALRLGNYELINLLLRFGANVNYFCRINTTHFPSALQYALRDQVLLRMLCSYGYDAQRCFDCPYGERAHVPDDYEGWTNTVIKDTMSSSYWTTLIM
ncbi:ankyrin repeat and SOCS box protein 14 isoform X2 [Gouania willdenowi]|uniref:ankyrin repeat and SOCS box protein 14 isoform X2 n=1 Tax=Gouania willdenowi TaxID=441366 RepID=UPI00105629E9|nr:ankyrin repeat and SOCS box protein 14 isoform X2 [Gouania willdenowi]